MCFILHFFTVEIIIPDENQHIKNMSNLTEVLSGLQQVTERNLEILKALNDSLYSKREHVVALIGGEKYVIPSYLYLEAR